MYKDKKILVIVPARGGSKGIKLKNLKKIKNKSLIELTSRFIDKLKFIDLKVLSSDHKKIIEQGKKLNFQIIKRNKKNAGDLVSDFEIIQEVLQKLKKKKLFFDILIYLQPTSPIRKIKHLKNSLDILIKNNLNAAWSVSKVNKKYHPLKILKVNNNKLKLFSKLGKKIVARQQLEDIYIRNGIFYIFKTNAILKNKSIYLEKTLASVSNYDYINIDDNKDLEIARKLIK